MVKKVAEFMFMETIAEKAETESVRDVIIKRIADLRRADLQRADLRREEKIKLAQKKKEDLLRNMGMVIEEYNRNDY